MRIGVDFDNTIVCYDKVFHKIALEQRLIPSDLQADKGSVRDFLRRNGQEEAWIHLQGLVYGSRIRESVPFPGVREFIAECGRREIELFIISHKTRHPFRGPLFDLHEAALDWLSHHCFFNSAERRLQRSHIYLELTKRAKIERIRDLECRYFIDDLPEFLAEPDFPTTVEKILFDPSGASRGDNQFHRASSWSEIGRLIFSEKVLR